MIRGQVFLQYAHDHPGEHLAAIHDESEAKLAQLIAEREAHEKAGNAATATRVRIGTMCTVDEVELRSAKGGALDMSSSSVSGEFVDAALLWMRARVWMAMGFVLSCSSQNSPSAPSDAAADTPSGFRCAGTWGCAGWADGAFTVWNLTNSPQGCVLGDSSNIVLEPGGALVRGGQVVGHVTGSGDSVLISLGGMKVSCRGATESTKDCSPTCGM
jgi:hypothetical protein